MAKEFGDFQTPPELVEQVIGLLHSTGKFFARVVEPTCGRGNFIQGLLKSDCPPQEIQAFEIQDDYVDVAKNLADTFAATRLVVNQANVFDLHFGKDLKWQAKGQLLVIGNPPWVTNSALGVLNSDNLPQKTNLKKLRGIEAQTGESNFDIAEYIWLKLMQELAHEKPFIALLCKTSVARKVLQFAFDTKLPIANSFIRRIEAQKWFNASVDACLFAVQIGADEQNYETPVYADLEAQEASSIIGIAKGQLVSDVKAYARSSSVDGKCSLTWRQGLKHDAASVMELRLGDSGTLMNKLGEAVTVEQEYLYPLLKSSDLFNGVTKNLRKAVIVPQKLLGENTRHLESIAPQLWNYLNSHSAMFERRKSSIYRGQSRFAIFGIGEYSFAAYKVAISGLHKSPRFRALVPVNNRPVMLDDTSYFIPCRSPEQAAFLTALLNSPVCLDLISSIIFCDSKRPVTKKLLQRIDFKMALEQANKDTLLREAETIFTNFDYQKPALWASSLESFFTENPTAEKQLAFQLA